MNKKTSVMLIASAVFAFLFILLIILLKTVDLSPIAADGSPVGLSTVNLNFQPSSGFDLTLYKITQWLGYAAIASALFFAALGVCQLVSRKSLKKVDREILLLGGLYFVTVLFYLFFEIAVVNCRPVLMPGKSAAEASFPSSHTMVVGVIAGSAAILLPKYLKNRILRLLLQSLCIGAALFVTVGRLLSGVHWFTDILGGLLLSLCLLSLFTALLDLTKRKGEDKNETVHSDLS